jgi:hypothetical protein
MNAVKLSMLGLLLAPLLVTINAANAVMVEHGESQFDVSANLSNGTVMSIEVDEDFTSVIVSIETDDSDGQLVINLPRALIDSTIDGTDDTYLVLVDGDEGDFTETSTTADSRELTIEVPGGAEEVEIVGTQVVPEFPIAVMAVMGAVIGTAIAAGRIRKPL